MRQYLSRKWSVIILSLVCLILVYFSHALWLPVFGKFLVVSDNLEKSDVIIVLGSHPKGARVDWAAKLYKRDLADKMIMCGYQVGWKTSTAEVMRKQAICLGVPEDAIILDYGWDNGGTWDNAINALRIVRQNNFKSAIVVTSYYHTRRSKLAFSKVFKDKDVTISVSPCPDGSFEPGEWWKRRRLIESVFLEYVKLMYYVLFPPQSTSSD